MDIRFTLAFLEDTIPDMMIGGIACLAPNETKYLGCIFTGKNVYMKY